MKRYAALILLALQLMHLEAPAVEYQPGIDVSHWQGNIDWTAVRVAGIKFTFAKATEGVDFIDVNFHQYMSSAMAAGVPIGPYHFARVNSNETNPLDAVSEADDFVDAIQTYYQSSAMVMRPVLDLENLPRAGMTGGLTNKQYVSKWVRDFNGRVISRMGLAPIIYTSGTFAQSYLEPDIAQYPLWFAKPTTNVGNNFAAASPPTASNIGIWSDWAFWQWSWTGDVGGINPVDRDAFEGTMEQLAAYIPTYRAGDFNRSGAVDAADYIHWRKTMGQSVNMGTAADGNLNGTIDADDLRVWRTNFDKAYGSGTGSGGGSMGGPAVPEPTALGLVSIAALMAGITRRKTRPRLADN